MKQFSKQMDTIAGLHARDQILLPLIKQHGWSDEQIANMLEPRIHFWKDFRNWTVRLQDYPNQEIPEIEAAVRAPQNDNRLVIQAFIINNVLYSYGVIPVKLLSHAIYNNVGCQDKMSKRDPILFRRLAFSSAKTMFGDQCYTFNI